MKLRYKLNEFLSRWGYVLGKGSATLEQGAEKRLQPQLAPWLSWLLQHRPQVFVVQVGAGSYHGVDELQAYLAKKAEMKGLLIEPQPGPYKDLCGRFSNRDSVEVAQMAVSDEEGDMEIHVPYIDGEPHGYLASLDRAMAEKAIIHKGERGVLKSVSVPVKSLDTILSSRGISEVQILQVDTEGLDDVVIRSVSLDRVRIDVIYFESAHLATVRREALLSHLVSFGYQIQLGEQDTIAVRSGLFEECKA